MKPVEFPLWFITSRVGVAVNPATGAMQLPDGFGVATAFHGRDPCIVLFSSQLKLLDYAKSQASNTANGLMGGVSNLDELRDLGSRFKNDYTHFLLDPGASGRTIRISDVLEDG